MVISNYYQQSNANFSPFFHKNEDCLQTKCEISIRVKVSLLGGSGCNKSIVCLNRCPNSSIRFDRLTCYLVSANGLANNPENLRFGFQILDYVFYVWSRSLAL